MLLENVRFLEDETQKKSIYEHASSQIVKNLSPLIDFFILDAFSVSHRNHASIVGFATVKPCIAGPILIEEITNLENALKKSSGITTWILGGAKIDDCIEVLEAVFEKKPELIQKVLTGGLLANLFLYSKGFEIGNVNVEILGKKNLLGLAERAYRLIEKYDLEIVLPVDFAVLENGNRKNVKLSDLPIEKQIMDIGDETIEEYKKIIRGSRRVIIKGPLGVYENPLFSLGSKEVLKAVVESQIFSLVGGGDTLKMIENLGFKNSQFSYTTLGGGAFIKFIAGKELAGIKALKVSYQIFKGNVNVSR